ncbi:hypothetical protein G7Z17_g10870 [Cylindrodendrum hubeiense]|uniref:Uncharacterized protein n=1 Tax=Cylindrodendrum hubeiense TaxID=595255 RepID=A0A9P5H0N6_9HYPO|nr:hypothetical protein G7Z17_g10870 [Cylindrodendrum hubeiense]
MAQNVTARYLTKARLQRVLEKLFPACEEFHIEMKDDLWVFEAPEKVDEVSTSLNSQPRLSSKSLYTTRYPEFKENESKWVIRQSGMYHRFDTTTRQSLYILFNPAPNSKAHQEAKELLLSNLDEGAQNDPFWLHQTLFSSYYPNWRQYIAAQEREVLKIRNNTIATYIDKPLDVGYDSLSTLVSLENLFLQAPVILSQTTEILDELLVLIGRPQSPPLLPAETTKKVISQLKHHNRQCVTYSRTAKYLLQRSQATVQLLAETLSFRNQVISKEQNETMLRLNKSVFFITAVTLFYLPASFVSTFFGMNFFAMDETNNRIIATSMIWIYIVTAVSLTGLTFLFYSWVLLYDGKAAMRI